MAKRLLCVVLVAFLCASCDLQKLMKDMTPAQDLALATECFELLRKHDFTTLETEYDPAARKAGLESALEAMAERIPADAGRIGTITNVNISTVNGHRTVSLTLLYSGATDWTAFDMRSEGDSADAMKVEALDVRKVAPPPAPSETGGLTTIIVLFGIAIWLVLMIVIYRRHARKAR